MVRLILFLLLVPLVSSAQFLHRSCDKYEAAYNATNPAGGILWLTGMSTLVSSMKQGGEKYKRDKDNNLSVATGLLGYITGWIVGASQSCAYGTAKLSKELKPGEINTYDTQERRRELRSMTLKFVMANSIANGLLYSTTDDPSSRDIAGAAAIVPWIILAANWKKFGVNNQEPVVFIDTHGDSYLFKTAWSF